MKPDEEKFSLDDQDVGVSEFNMPEAKINLARWILASFFILILLAFITTLLPETLINARSGKFVESIFQSIVPMASMVIGYYFAKD